MNNYISSFKRVAFYLTISASAAQNYGQVPLDKMGKPVMLAKQGNVLQTINMLSPERFPQQELDKAAALKDNELDFYLDYSRWSKGFLRVAEIGMKASAYFCGATAVGIVIKELVTRQLGAEGTAMGLTFGALSLATAASSKWMRNSADEQHEVQVLLSQEAFDRAVTRYDRLVAETTPPAEAVIMEVVENGPVIGQDMSPVAEDR